MAERARRGQPRWGRRRTVIGATVVAVALLASGAGAWAAESTSSGGYRMGKVVRATVSKSLTVVGTVQPVSDASVAFQVGGKVATVAATVGQNVTAGQSLATLSTTALSETVSSAQSSLSSAEAKLTQDENSQSSPSGSSTTTTTTPAHNNANTGGNPTGTNTATITQDQNTLTADETTTNADQQQEAADLVQAKSACGASSGSGGTTTTTSTSTTTTTAPSSSSTSACTTALQKVSDDQQQVSVDEATVAKDESTLAKDLGDTSSPSSPSSPTGSSGSPGTGTGSLGSHALAAAGTGTPSSNGASPTGTSSPGGNGSSAASDTPQQIAEDQAAIDTARANLIEAQQALSGAQLTSPINGTIVSIGMAVGDTVSAGSSTAVIVIIGTYSFEVSTTLTSSQVASVKVGDTATVSVDGLTTTTNGTVSQVGPVQSTSSGYTYPVVISLPSSVQGLFSGSSANVTIATGQVTDVVVVPTSAVITQGSRSYVEMLDNGVLTRKTVHLGMVGGVYTEVRSGLSVGQSVVLADLSLAVPSSNTASLGGGGLFGGGGGGRFRQFVGVAPGAGGGGGVVPGQSVTIGG